MSRTCGEFTHTFRTLQNGEIHIWFSNSVPPTDGGDIQEGDLVINTASEEKTVTVTGALENHIITCRVPAWQYLGGSWVELLTIKE